MQLPLHEIQKVITMGGRIDTLTMNGRDSKWIERRREMCRHSDSVSSVINLQVGES